MERSQEGGVRVGVSVSVEVGVQAGALGSGDATATARAAMADAAHDQGHGAVLYLIDVLGGTTLILVHGALHDAAPVPHPARSLILLDQHHLHDPPFHNHISHIHLKEFLHLHLRANSRSLLRILSLLKDLGDILFHHHRPRTTKAHGHLHHRLRRQEGRSHRLV